MAFFIFKNCIETQKTCQTKIKRGGNMKSRTKQNSSKQKTNKILAILTLCSLGITAIIIGQFLVLDNHTNKILQNGTVINGLNLSGMNKDEAQAVLLSNFKDKAEDFELEIIDSDSNQSWKFNKNDLEVNSDIHTIIDASQDKNAYTGEDDERVDFLSQFDRSGSSINIAFNYIFTGLDEKIEGILKEVEIEPINSTIEFTPNNTNKFVITESSTGRRVDKNALYQDINSQFLTSNKISVNLKYKDEIPAITKEYNQSLTHNISSFTTKVADSTGGRKHNVKLALSKFNGMEIAPGQSVSFNEIVGEHTTENGFKTATIIYNGEFTEGIGGGICQASTTLYNALLLGGVQIDEVHRHTLPVKYVPLALDAMVAEYTSDLKFTNTSEYPIYIRTYANKDGVGVDLYSHELEYTYKTRSETVATIKSDGDKIIPDTDGKYASKVLFKGEYFRISYSKDGYEAKSYLQKYLGDKLIEEKMIRHEIYLAQRGVVIEGVEELPAGVSPIDNGVKIVSR